MSIFLSRWAKLYSNLTPAERSLEPALASMGQPYRVQHPLWHLGIFPDFVLPADKLVIEVDDDGHRRAAAIKKDAERTEKLKASGWHVVRCTNAEALNDPYSTVNRLMEEAGLPHRTNPRDASSTTPRPASPRRPRAPRE